MGFGSTMTSKEGTAARDGSRRHLGRLDPGLRSDTRARRGRYGTLMLVQASAVAAAVGGAAAPGYLIANQGRRRSHLPSALASSETLASPLTTPPLRPRPSPSLTPWAPPANQASSRPSRMVFAPEWLGVAAGRWLALADYTIAHSMSGSFVHRSIIAGCRYSNGYLRSGPQEEGRHAEE